MVNVPQQKDIKTVVSKTGLCVFLYFRGPLLSLLPFQVNNSEPAQINYENEEQF